MEDLTRQTSNITPKKYTSTKVLQFGEGNFLRAFVDWIVYQMNNNAGFDAGVTVVQPIDKGMVDVLNQQDGLYTLLLNGIKKGKAVSEKYLIDCINKGINPYQEYETYLMEAENPDLQFIVSNTTEAGIAYSEKEQWDDKPAASFPGKLTQLLYRRYKTFNGSKESGLFILPCELINKNGHKLKEIILQYAELWALDMGFIHWLESANFFYNTLVDRIVPGYPKDRIEAIGNELGYKDQLVVEGEQFHLWVIEGPDHIRDYFPAKEAGLNVVFTDDLSPYRTRKVRILNGTHTTMVPVGLLFGTETVREAMEHKVIGPFLQEAIFKEIIPTLDLSKKELESFADQVVDRFKNPYIKHYLASIALNSLSKFETRVLPSILMYKERKEMLPKHLIFGLAALIRLYKGDVFDLKDDQENIAFMNENWKKYGANNVPGLVQAALGFKRVWKMDLNEIDGMQDQVTRFLEDILNKGIEKAIQDI